MFVVIVCAFAGNVRRKGTDNDAPGAALSPMVGGAPIVLAGRVMATARATADGETLKLSASAARTLTLIVALVNPFADAVNVVVPVL